MNRNIKNGTVVSVPKGFVEHVGIIASNPYRGHTVISNSGKYGRVVEQTLSDFSQGKEIAVKGYIGELPSWQVIRNARSFLNEKYNLFSNNCEHLVTRAHGKVKESPQLKFWMLVGFIIALWVWLSKK